MAGDAIEVPYRETRTLGDYTVMHGDNVEGYWGGKQILAGVVRGAL